MSKHPKPMVRAYDFVLDDEEATIFIPAGLKVPEAMAAVHADSMRNALKAIEAWRAGQMMGPSLYGLADESNRIVGGGFLKVEDDAESIAVLATLFAEMGLRLALVLPDGVTTEQLGAPLHKLVSGEQAS